MPGLDRMADQSGCFFSVSKPARPQPFVTVGLELRDRMSRYSVSDSLAINVVAVGCYKFSEPLQYPGRKLLGGQSKTGPLVIRAGLHRRVESEPSADVGRPSSVSEIGTRHKPRKHESALDRMGRRQSCRPWSVARIAASLGSALSRKASTCSTS